MGSSKKAIFTLICLFVFINNINSQTYIPTGEVSGVWTKANSPYILDDCYVPEGKTLKIEAGVIVQMNSFAVNGTITAIGNKKDSIVFTKKEGATNRSTFIINNNTASDDSSKLSYCTVEEGTADDLYLAGGLTIRGSKTVISNCTFRKNRGWFNSALLIYECNPVVKNTIFYENSNSLLFRVYSSSEVEFKNCIITNNAGWVVIEGNTKLSNCVINKMDRVVFKCCKMINSIFSNNKNVEINYDDEAKNCEISYCNFEFGTDSIRGDKSRLIFTHNIDFPSKFKDPEHYDFSLLKSACINGGDPNTQIATEEVDFLGNPRIYNDTHNIIDIGAIEYQGSITNRTAYVRTPKKVSMIKSTQGKLSLNFKDLDKNDSHSCSVSSDNPNVAVGYSKTDSSFLINISPNLNYTGTSKIGYCIKDNSGSDNDTFSDTIQVIVSNELSGLILGEFRLKDTIYIIGDIIVDKGSVLNIEAGAKLLFKGWYKIDVQGRLKAEGKKDSRIEFNALDTVWIPDCDNVIKRGWAGMYFSNSSSRDTCFLRNCDIKNTGVYSSDYQHHSTINILNSNSISIDSCNFIGNWSTGYFSNSGVYIVNSNNISIKNSKFKFGCSNPNIKGGYIFADKSLFEIKNCVFDTILSADTRWNVVNEVYLSNSKGTIYSSEFKNQNCDQTITIMQGDYIVENCVFHNNIGSAIESIGFDNDRAIIRNNKFYKNVITFYGLINSRCKGDLIMSNLFLNNKLQCNCSNFLGGSINLDDDALVANNTFVNNTQDANGSTVYASYCHPTVVNNIFWNNSNEGFGYYNGAGIGLPDPIVKNNLIKNATGSFNFNPQFRLENELDYQLSATSPCINKGMIDTLSKYLPELDILGNKRIDSVTGLIDLGAYEFVLKNHNPTELSLVNSDIYIRTPKRIFISKITAKDQDENQKLYFDVVDGDGINDADNQKFLIRNDSLFIKDYIEIKSQDSYHINLAVYDGKGGQQVKAFQLSVKNEILSVNDKFENNIQVYPNPVNNILTIDSNENYVLKVFNTTGNMLYTQNIFTGKNQIDFSGIKDGIYLIELIGKTNLIKKIIKM